MLIHWKEARVWIVGLPGLHDEKTGNTSGDTVILIPGVHPISDEDWARIKEVPDVKARIEDKTLEALEPEKTTKGAAAKDTTEGGYPKTLDSFKPADAVEFVGGVMELDVLKSWAKIEKRPVVAKQIKAQIETLEEKDEKKD
jgi:hypothetical protein